MYQHRFVWMRRTFITLPVLLVLLSCLQVQRAYCASPTLLVYCAVALRPALETVAKQYQQEYGVTVQAQYGASGGLLSNIKVTKQGDLFLPADESYLTLANTEPPKLISSTVPLAYMTPVILLKGNNPLNIHSVQDLIDRKEVRMAFANPDAASIGRTTRIALEKSGQWASFSPRITVMLPTVSDVANAVKLGSVDAGVVWDAVAKQYPDLAAVHDKAVLDSAKQRVLIGVLTTSTQADAARRFARYFGAADKGLKALHDLGYVTPKGKKWKP